jgi:zinc protease
MIEYSCFELKNGLKVYVHEDKTTPMAVVNILYNVGSKDEQTNKTGFAHLFEHLMFGGSVNIPSYDTPLQKVGGENNAFTSPDITNYYLSVPYQNLETAFWLESDRMLGLSFDPKVLEIQQKVVVEEFKQRYLNQPYGDIWLKLRPLAYQVHPYQWATIGKEIKHIEDITIDDVKAFFYKFYVPSNAVLVVGGNVTVKGVEKLAKKWFGPIPQGKAYTRNLPIEPVQTQKRFLKVEANVPLNAFYQTFHTVDRIHEDYYASDLLTDILSRGKSSKLYHELVKENKIFNTINAYTMGSVEPGLIVIEGKLNEGIAFETAESAVWDLLMNLKNTLTEEELKKVQNQTESSLVMGEVELLNRAMNLAFAANLGNANLYNEEITKIQGVKLEDLLKIARKTFLQANTSVIHYQKTQ